MDPGKHGRRHSTRRPASDVTKRMVHSVRRNGLVLVSILLLSCQSTGRPPDIMLPTEPQAEATTLDVLVLEVECASGRSADGRIELRNLEETADEIHLRITVRQLPGNQDCQGSPATPFSIDLTDPVGQRTIIDVGQDTPTPLPVATEMP